MTHGNRLPSSFCQEIFLPVAIFIQSQTAEIFDRFPLLYLTSIEIAARVWNTRRRASDNLDRFITQSQGVRAPGVVNCAGCSCALSPERIRMVKAHEEHWSWRLEMAAMIAKQTDPLEFGIAGFYIIGSTRTGTAGPSSDIDLLLHLHGTLNQRQALEAWLQGWSVYLDELNYRRTGYRRGGLLHLHFVTDDAAVQQFSRTAQKLPMLNE